MEEVDRVGCSLPRSEGPEPQRWLSARVAAVTGAWSMTALMVAGLATHQAAWLWAAAGIAALWAPAMRLCAWRFTLERLRRGSGMNPRNFEVYWHGQALSLTVCAVGIVAAATAGEALWGSALLIALVAGNVLAQLTPFCAGRMAYLLLFERRPVRGTQ